MFRRAGLASMALLLGAPHAAAAAGTTFAVTEAPAFAPVAATLAELVRTSPRSGPHHLCVVGYDRPTDKYAHAWVHWREGNALVLWEPMGPAGSALVHSRRHLQLDHDVVASEADLHGSTYLVTKAWVAKTLHDCDTHGRRFVVTR